MSVDWRPLLELIDQHQRFVISSHVRPDGDAIGSEIGLADFLVALGKDVQIVNPGATPGHLRFLDPDERAKKIGTTGTSEAVQNAEVHLIVDTSAWTQLQEVGPSLRRSASQKVVIDHHLRSDELNAIEFRDVTAAATGVLIQELIATAGKSTLDTQSQALFTAIATDTGWFRFPNVDARTLRAAAWLVDHGAQPSTIYRELYENSSLARLKLHSIVLGRVEVLCGGRLAHTWTTQADFRETGAAPADTEDLVNDCLTIQGVEAAFILVEQLDGRIKASLRSRSDLSVAAIAEQFGGGGHRQAAGAMLPGPITGALQVLCDAITRALPEVESDASAAEPSVIANVSNLQ